MKDFNILKSKIKYLCAEYSSLKKENERLREENAALKSSLSKGLSLRVSEKGALSVYGLGRFPVTLYKEQWLRLLDMNESIQTFIKQNESKLKTKAKQS